nr:MAG TPA: hypothetical protein [Bacteriophage sp.]
MIKLRKGIYYIEINTLNFMNWQKIYNDNNK